jgi:hypothetical protein
VIGESLASVIDVGRFQVCSIEPLEVYERLAVGKANPAPDRAKAASSSMAILFYLFKSRKDNACSPTLLSRAKAGNCGSMRAIPLGFIEKDIKE